MVVEQTTKSGAPFFVYANVNDWEQITIPDTITDMTALESFIDEKTINAKRIFAIKISGGS